LSSGGPYFSVIVCPHLWRQFDSRPGRKAGNVRIVAHIPADTPVPESIRGKLVFGNAVTSVLELTNLSTQKP
jgi:hypothetical protein